MTELPTLPADAVRVLLVEDNDGDARLVQLMLLGRYGSDFDLTRASDLAEAIARLDIAPCDCVILDLELPDASGLEALDLIKTRFPMTAVVVLTGQAGGEMGMLAVTAGAQDYLRKGVAVDETLARAVRYAVVRKHGEDALVRSRQALGEAQAIAQVGSWELDIDTDAMVWSDELCRLYDRPLDAAGGLDDLLDRVHPDDRESLDRQLRAAMEGCASFDVEHRIVAADGTMRWLRSRGRVELGGETAWMHGTALDITERKQNDANLAAARDEAIEASELKSRFLANMSHELRTPLNGVLGLMSLMLETDLTVRQRDFAETAVSSGEALLAILSDILDFSKIEAGRIDLEVIAFDIGRLVEEVGALFRAQAEKKGLELVTTVPADLPWIVRGDPWRLRQVLSNLIGNAIKFASVGQVILELTVVGGNDTTTEVRFEVVDNGIGIAEQDQAALFDPFSQVDAATTRQYGGTGLGLAICRQLVELMGGNIGVRSETGVGSAFWFTLSLLHPEPATPDVVAVGLVDGPPATLPAPPQATPRPSARRILLAEDNLVNQKVAAAMLENLGFDVEVVANGAEALETVTQAPYQSILMDCQMPIMDGYRATAEIRRRHRGKHHTPIIAVTASAMESDRRRCLDAGMDDYLTKPLTQKALAATLLRWARSDR